ncbi:MAG: hypothetical protein L6461_00305 [Anaerolineae bacterium]|nr:hypothetical protein [Anaerolineae bacterium]
MRKILFVVLILAVLSACAPAAPTSQSPDASPAPTETLRPTAGPTPTMPSPLAILLIPADLNEDVSRNYQSAIYDLAQAAGLRYQVRNVLSVEDLALEPNLKVVIALAPDPGLSALAAAAPQAQFLAVNIPDIAPGGNISVLGGEGIRADQQAFMAGYIGALVTDDFFEVGAILRKDSPESAVIQKAFGTGRTYYCGLCRPIGLYTPFEYPAFIEIPGDAKPSEYTAYADVLILQKKVATMFIQPGLDVPELLDYLTITGVLMIGTQTPHKPLSSWVVTLQPDYLKATIAAWPSLVAGEGGRIFPAPLTFTDINEELFSVGKQRLAEETMQAMFEGFISTGQ